MKNFSKIRLLKIWELLKAESDEERPLTTNEIISALKKDGITCDRRTLYDDICTLTDNGYDIQTRRGVANEYCVLDRSFDVPELHILMDAVQAAGFITEKKTAELVNKIANLAGSYRAQLLKRNVVKFNTTKHRNEVIYYSVDAICAAIAGGKKVSFKYFDYNADGERVYRKNGATYTVNPLATVFVQDNYYLVCYDDKHGNAVNYRIDRMDKVETCEQDVVKSKISENFDVSEHRRQTFSMYRGEAAVVSFEADDSLTDAIFDKFGETVSVKNAGCNKISFSAEVQLSPTFFAWCCGFGNRLKIISPEHVAQEYKDYLSQILSVYA